MSQSLKDEFVQGVSPYGFPMATTTGGGLERMHSRLGQEKQRTLELEFGSNVVAFPFPEQMLVRNIRTLLSRGRIVAANKLAGLLPNSSRYRELKEVLSPPRFRKIKSKRQYDPKLDYDWISKNFENYGGQWVALKSGSLLASADSLAELRANLGTQPTLLYHIQSAQNR